jgi:hypothetical protein
VAVVVDAVVDAVVTLVVPWTSRIVFVIALLLLYKDSAWRSHSLLVGLLLGCYSSWNGR